MPCSGRGSLTVMARRGHLTEGIIAIVLGALLRLGMAQPQPVSLQAYTLPGLRDLPALPGLASGLINSVTTGASWLAGLATKLLSAP